MPTFIMLTRLNPDAVRSPSSLEQLERQAMDAIRKECPGVEWLGSYAVLGPCDYLDVFLANDIETATQSLGSHPHLRACQDRDLGRDGMGSVQGDRPHASGADLIMAGYVCKGKTSRMDQNSRPRARSSLDEAGPAIAVAIKVAI